MIVCPPTHYSTASTKRSQIKRITHRGTCLSWQCQPRPRTRPQPHKTHTFCGLGAIRQALTTRMAWPHADARGPMLPTLTLQVRVLPRRVVGKTKFGHRSEFTLLPGATQNMPVLELQNASALLSPEGKLAVIDGIAVVFCTHKLPSAVALVVQPLALVAVAIGVLEYAIARSSIVRPLSMKTITVGVDELTFTFLLGIHPVAHELIAVCVHKCAFAVHLVCLPKAVVLLSVLVRQCAVALLHVVDPFTIVCISVGEDIDAFPMHLAVVPVPLINSPVCILVFPMAVHLAIYPITLEFLHDAAPSTHVCHHALSVTLVITPFSLVDVAFRVTVGPSGEWRDDKRHGKG